MADTPVLNVIANGFKNCIVSVNLVSDGSGFTNFKIYDATSTGSPFNTGVLIGGQTFYGGRHTSVVGLDYDVQSMNLEIMWDATSNQNLFPLGNAPEDFDWKRMGGIPCPAGLTGATGSIVISSLGQVPGASFAMILYLWKGIRT